MSRPETVRTGARRIAADHYLGRTVTVAAKEWAARALTAGCDGHALRMLAATGPDAVWSETAPYLHDALAEVGRRWPRREEALWADAEDTASAVLSGEGGLEAGVLRLARLARALDYPPELLALYGLEDDLEVRYGPGRIDRGAWSSAATAEAERFLARRGRNVETPPPSPLP